MSRITSEARNPNLNANLRAGLLRAECSLGTNFAKKRQVLLEASSREFSLGRDLGNHRIRRLNAPAADAHEFVVGEKHGTEFVVLRPMSLKVSNRSSLGGRASGEVEPQNERREDNDYSEDCNYYAHEEMLLIVALDHKQRAVTVVNRRFH